MTVLTPLAALAAFAAVVPLAAHAAGARRAAAVRRALGLEPPARSALLARPALAAGAVVLLGLAAAQPALTHSSSARVRSDVQALFVLDTSRSMAASRTPRSPTRLDRAVVVAARLRAAIPNVPAGVATLTDRVLPDLLPVSGAGVFDAVVTRAVAIESPPPRETSARATSYTELAQVATGNVFPRSAKRRLVILVGDGESRPVDTATVARALAARRGYRLVTVRTWNAGESVFGAEGRAETGYRPDPSGEALMRSLAGAVGGRAFDERRAGAAASYLRGLAGSGPTETVHGLGPTRTPLAPYLAAVALALLLAATARLSNVAATVRFLAR